MQTILQIKMIRWLDICKDIVNKMWVYLPVWQMGKDLFYLFHMAEGPCMNVELDHRTAAISAHLGTQ